MKMLPTKSHNVNHRGCPTSGIIAFVSTAHVRIVDVSANMIKVHAFFIYY